MNYKFIITKSNNPKYKYDIYIYDTDKDKIKKTLRIGSVGNSDFILSNGDLNKKKNYIARHSVNEKWGLDGILSKGFWARWLLWNKSNLIDSINDIKKRFNLNVVYLN